MPRFEMFIRVSGRISLGEMHCADEKDALWHANRLSNEQGVMQQTIENVQFEDVEVEES